MEIKDDLLCVVTTNKAYENACTVDLSRTTITIINVFSESIDFYSTVSIELKYVSNPLNNKDQGLGFSIFTYTDEFQTYQIDFLPNTKMVPTLKCTYPCRECQESDKSNCASCWTEAWADYKYFFLDPVSNTG